MKKKISFTEIVVQLIIGVLGIIAAYYAIELDVFSSGAKYID